VKQFVGFLIVFLLSFSHRPYLQGIKDVFTKSTPFHFEWGSDHFLDVGMESEVGYWNDGALYASFGLETQIARFSKLLVTVAGGYTVRADHSWIYHVDFAPLYDSICYKSSEAKIYGQNHAGQDINGANIYYDWYKNLGSRVYDTGNLPLVEAYGGVQLKGHQLKIGRLKNTAGFEDHEMPFKDDGKFAPMGLWSVRDLLTGFSYRYKQTGVEAGGSVFSGANPMKSGSRYLNGSENANMKANNTPTLEGYVRFNYGDFLSDKTEGFVGWSMQRGTKGSSWADVLQEGKRLSTFWALNFLWRYHFDKGFFRSCGLWGQYVQYKSGLATGSCQNDGHPRFRLITQKGFFVGGDVGVLDEFFLWAAYERMDRMDPPLFERLGYPSAHALFKAKQSSIIVGTRWFFQPFASMEIAFHKINNPARFASDIWDKRSDSRMKVTLKVVF